MALWAEVTRQVWSVWEDLIVLAAVLGPSTDIHPSTTRENPLNPVEIGSGEAARSGSTSFLTDGVVYMWNRWQDPETGRFISEDPARDGNNWYGYAGNNPETFTDPTGLEPHNGAADGYDKKPKKEEPKSNNNGGGKSKPDPKPKTVVPPKVPDVLKGKPQNGETDPMKEIAKKTTLDKIKDTKIDDALDDGMNQEERAKKLADGKVPYDAEHVNGAKYAGKVVPMDLNKYDCSAEMSAVAKKPYLSTAELSQEAKTTDLYSREAQPAAGNWTVVRYKEAGSTVEEGHAQLNLGNNKYADSMEGKGARVTAGNPVEKWLDKTGATIVSVVYLRPKD